jgi:NOL1/NOP2/fmu family ribosome biogenesis protein
VKREALQLFDGPKLLYKWLWKKELLSFLNLILCCLPIGQYSGILLEKQIGCKLGTIKSNCFLWQINLTLSLANKTQASCSSKYAMQI